MFEAKFQGIDALTRKAKGLTDAVRARLARNAVMSGAAIIRNRARQNALSLDSGETQRTIAKNVASRFRTKLSKRTGDPTASVGVLMTKTRIPSGNPDEPQNTNHWHLLELGTENMQARPFLAPAAMQSQARVMPAIAQNLDAGIERELKKLK